MQTKLPKPEKPNLKLADFVRDREGCDKLLQEYDEALRIWTQEQWAALDPVPSTQPRLRWRVDLRVYEPLYRGEIPIIFPIEWFKPEPMGSHARLASPVHGMNDGLPIMTPGYRVAEVTATEDDFDRLVDWCNSQGSLKIIGITPIVDGQTEATGN